MDSAVDLSVVLIDLHKISETDEFPIKLFLLPFLFLFRSPLFLPLLPLPLPPSLPPLFAPRYQSQSQPESELLDSGLIPRDNGLHPLHDVHHLIGLLFRVLLFSGQ